jgi:GxxExxY protein
MISLTQKYLDEITFEVIGAAIEVHKTMGKGLLESAYHQCMIEELKYRKINFLSELKIPVIYRSKVLQIDFRCDLYVENCLIVELKAVSEINNNVEAQLLTYMKLLKSPKGIVINFNCSNIFKYGQKTYVNDYFSQLPKR